MSARPLVLWIALLATACGYDEGSRPRDGAVGDGAVGDGAVAGGDAAIDDATSAPIDAAADGPRLPDAAVGISCGAETCNTATHECCTLGPSSRCVPVGTCTGETVGCDGPEDCLGGQVCCQAMTGTGCRATLTCAVVVCHVDADCPAIASRCCPSAAGNRCAPACPGA